MSKKRIGVLTGGGDCPGLNAAIRAVVKTAIGVYGWDVLGIVDGFKGLLTMSFRRLDYEAVRGLVHRGGTILGTATRDNPFNFPQVVDGVVKHRDVSGEALDNAKALGLEALIVIGGEGTLSIANMFFKMGLPIVGIPKTIDKDVRCTEATIGFNTAVITAMDAIDKLHTTAESHHRVMVLEVMGRNAGWIGLESGLAGGADVILIPEIPFDIQKVCDKVAQRKDSGRLFSIVVASEGAHPLAGEQVYRDPQKTRLGGIGERLGAEIEARTGIETRVIVLGHLQRGGSPSAFDRVLAARFGRAAVELVEHGQFGKMVCLASDRISSATLDEATESLNLVDPECDTVLAAESLGISLGR